MKSRNYDIMELIALLLFLVGCGNLVDLNRVPHADERVTQHILEEVIVVDKIRTYERSEFAMNPRYNIKLYIKLRGEPDLLFYEQKNIIDPQLDQIKSIRWVKVYRPKWYQKMGAPQITSDFTRLESAHRVWLDLEPDVTLARKVIMGFAFFISLCFYLMYIEFSKDVTPILLWNKLRGKKELPTYT